MQFRLAYGGPLFGATDNDNRPGHKHEIRKVFHKQLQNYWSCHQFLRTWQGEEPLLNGQGRQHMVSELAERFSRDGFNFVPLVIGEWALSCAVSILMLRAQPKGKIIQSGDIDNRLKTIFDALRLPKDSKEMGQHTMPDENEKPFFCLLEDDSLITHTSIETDILLEPIRAEISESDVRLLLTITILPLQMTYRGMNFAGQ